MSSPHRDTTPGLRSAGMTSNGNRGGIAACLSEAPHPSTPDNIKRFRGGSTRPLGKSGLHPGLAQDGPRNIGSTYGSVNKFDGNVSDCLSPHKHSLIAARLTQQEMKEPLGRSPLKSNTKLPESTKKEKFAFGVTSNKSENAHNVIYPAQSANEVVDAKRDAGHQKDRQYDWTVSDINPATHRFGKSHQTSEKVKIFSEDSAAIINSPTKAQRALHNAEIGSPKRMGYAPQLQDQHTFGKKLAQDEFTVNELVKGMGAPKELIDDIGKPVQRNPHVRSVRNHDRAAFNETQPADRTFGVPSVRSDLPTPKNEKVTNNINFGADPGANQLLYPTPTVDSHGLGLKPLSLGEAIRLSSKCNFDLTEEEVVLCYKVALKNSGPRKLVSATSFTRAIEQAGF